MAVYFAHDQNAYATIEGKAKSDVLGVAKNDAYGMAFVTNQELTEAQRESLKSAVGVPLDLFHLERITLVLDTPRMRGVRRQYLNIDYGQNGSQRTGPTEADRLQSALDAAGMRRMQRLRAAGVAEDRRPHVEAWMKAHPRPPLSLAPDRRVTLLSAPMGYGKTEVAHQWLDARIRDTIASPDSPFPLWLHARDIHGAVEAHVTAELGREIVHEIGCAVVLDGLDELAPTDAVRLFESAEEFCSAWPKCTVVATAKPEPLMADFPAIIIEKWAIQDGRALAEEVAGTDLPHSWWTDEVAEALKTPLLALALGARAAAGAPAPGSRAALIEEIAEQSVRAARLALSTATTTALITVAAHTLSTGTPYPAAQLDADVLAAVVATPLIIQSVGELSFALPVLELVYAARALRRGDVSLADVSSSSQFLRWRYALALAVDSTNPIESDRRLAEAVAANPLAGSWVLDELAADSHAQQEASAAPLTLELRHQITTSDPNSHLSPASLARLEQLRDAHRTWVSALGLLGHQLVRAEGASLPGWSASLRDSWMLIGRRRATDGVDIHGTAMPANPFNDVRPHWLAEHNLVTISSVPTGRFGRWTWTRADLRKPLEARLRQFRLDSDPAGPLAAERTWWLAQLLFHGGLRGHHRPIALDPVVRKIDERLAQTADAVRATWTVSGGKEYTREDLVWLREWITTQLPADQTVLERPTPAPDREPGGAWVWSVYTAERMYALTTWVLENAANGYADLISRNFPESGSVLNHVDLSPMHIVGELVTAPDEQTDGDIGSGPLLHYTITKAPSGTSQPIIDITRSTHGDPPRADINFNEYRWSSTTALRLEGARPATEWAYQWLIDDLAALGWVEPKWSTHY
jgi:hypothetical protein